MPEGTPVAAPAAPAAPAPVSTPTPSVSTPAPVSMPVSAPVSTPETTPAHTDVTTPSAETPAATTPAATGKPERSAYDQTAEGVEKFLKDTYAWEEANPDNIELVTGDEITVETPAVEKTAEEIAAEAEAAAAPKTDEPAKVEVESPTPEGLSKILEAHPGLKEALEAAPEAKGAIYAMARQNAKAAPVLEIVPNVEAAKFAVDNANQFVGLKTAFTLSDTPEKMKDAAGMFLEQFKIVDDKGQPVLDAKGNPTYGDELPMFVSEMKTRDNSVRMDDLKQRIEANQYVSAEGKNNDEQLLAAYEFIAAAEAAEPGDLDKPDTSQMTPEAKAYFDKKDAELTAEKERLGIKDKEMSKKAVAETRAKYDTQYREKFGGSSGKFMASYLEQQEKAGVVIPHYLLEMKDPKTGVSVFALQAFNALNEKLANLPQVKAHSATLQMNALNEQGLTARLSYGQELINEHLPGIIDGILEKAGVSLMKDAQKKIADRTARQGDARVEPAQGGPVVPKGMSPEQLYAKAKENVIANAKGAYIAPDEMIRKTLVERDRLEAQR